MIFYLVRQSERISVRLRPFTLHPIFSGSNYQRTGQRLYTSREADQEQRGQANLPPIGYTCQS